MNIDELEALTTSMMMRLPDDKFRLAIVVAAKLFAELRQEAVRRGIWEQLKGDKELNGIAAGGAKK